MTGDTPPSHLALELRGVEFSYRVSGRAVPALNGLSLKIARGEMVAIQGPSGSGKSTLLYLLGCMLKSDRGVIRVLGQDVGRMSDVQLAYFRNRRLGFVFQQFHLLPSTDVLDNILLPTAYPLEDLSVATSLAEDRKRALILAERLGLSDRLHHKTQQLSGGQQQRVAIARALIRDAPVILADEPTGNLDSASSAEILRLLRELNSEGKTVVIITHDAEVAAKCDRVIWIRDGRVVDSKSQTLAEAALETDTGRASGAGRAKPRDFTSVVEEKFPPLSGLKFSALLSESFPRAWANLRRNRLRSFLTMLGVVVGVASIMAMLTLGEFTKEKILQSYASLGINTLVFSADPNWQLKASDRPPNSFRSLDMERDVLPLRDVFPEIHAISPLYQSYNHSAVFGGRIIENEVSVVGIGSEGLQITRRQMAVGTPITPYHVEHRSTVCVIGFELAERLFQRRSPLGEAIQVIGDESSFSCTVIGVSQTVHSKDVRFRPDMQVIVPYTTFQSLPVYWYYRMLHSLVIEVDPRADVEQTGLKIQAYFQNRYGASGRFKPSNDSVLVAQMKRFLNLFTLLLVSIAALSLLVGGMGITNMMLVSVSERFREIGLRKALGASHSAIRQQFFAESLFLCGLAGVIGVVLGFVAYECLISLGAKIIPDLQFAWIFNPTAFFISIAAIGVTGVLSGLGPALRAEKLEVIEALRSE